MGSDIGKGGILGQILLFIVNCIFIVLGIIALAIGIWAIVSGNAFSFLTGSQVIGGAALLIITGGAIIVIAGVGIFGAICKVRVLLIIYALVVLVIVILEIVAGILAFVYRDTVVGGIQDGIGTTLISQYNISDPNSDANTVVDFFQNNFQCCGVENATDWVNFNLDAITQNNGQPPNCAVCTLGEGDCATFFYDTTVVGVNVTLNFTTTDVGCASINTNALLALAVGAGVVGIIFGLLEISGIIISLLLCCCIHRAHKQTVV